jgi:hypothetical protein
MSIFGLIVGTVGHYNRRNNPEIQPPGTTNGAVSLNQVPYLVLLVGGSPANSNLVWFVLPELAVFALEDATAIFVWAETGTYDTANTIALASLIVTCTSAAIIVGMLGFAVVRFFVSRKAMGFNATIFSCSKHGSAWRDEDSRAFLLLIGGSFAVVLYFSGVALGAVYVAGPDNGGGTTSTILDGGLLISTRVVYAITLLVGIYMTLIIRGSTIHQWKKMPLKKERGCACNLCCSAEVGCGGSVQGCCEAVGANIIFR